MSIYVLPTQPKKSPQIEAIVMDAFITEEHVFNSDVADHPTEKGYPISDNVVQKPIELTLEVVVSPSPLQTTLPEPLSRADTKYKQLRRLQRNGLRVSVVTGLTRYTNMMITNVTIPRSKETSQVLRFNISLKEVRVSNTSKVSNEGFAELPPVVPVVPEPVGLTPEDVAGYNPVKEVWNGEELSPIGRASNVGSPTGGLSVSYLQEPTSDAPSIISVEDKGKLQQNLINAQRGIK